MAPLSISPYGHFGTFLVSEAEGYRSREQVQLAAGSGKLLDGTVLGRKSSGAKSAVAAEGAGNTGAATIGTTATAAADAQVGVWRIMCDVEDKLKIYRPDGVFEAEAVVGIPYSGGIGFTVAANADHADPGDFYTVTVTAAAGSGEYAPYNPTHNDGTEIASAILLGDYDTTAAKQAAVIVRAAEVQTAMLVFVDKSPATPPSAGEKNAAYQQLAHANIAFR